MERWGRQVLSFERAAVKLAEDLPLGCTLLYIVHCSGNGNLGTLHYHYQQLYIDAQNFYLILNPGTLPPLAACHYHYQHHYQ